MSNTKVELENLKPGQEVSVAGYVATGIVVRREAKNLYTVRCRGREILVERNKLGVNRFGKWITGPTNERL